MEINETTFPLEFDWEGELVPPTGVFAPGGKEAINASIGKPYCWSDPSELLGDNWAPPAGGKRYWLARFAFSLGLKQRQTARRAEFTVDLLPGAGNARPIVFDLLPIAVTEEQTGSIKAGIGPNFKFEGGQVSLAKLETTVNLREVTSVISADGVGESKARWVFTARRGHPLTGSQLVYAIVELPSGVSAALARMQLTVEATTSLGPVQFFLPKTETGKRWKLPPN